MYIKLVENSKICRDKKYKDQLAPLPDTLKPPPSPIASQNFSIKDMECVSV
jgi:hypothetical protein